MALGWVIAPCHTACALAPSSWSGHVDPRSLSPPQRQPRGRRGVPATASARDDRDEEAYPCPVRDHQPISRASALRLVGSAGFFFAVADPADALDSQRDPRTAVAPPRPLLMPVVGLRAAAARVLDLLDKPSDWEEARSLLASPPLSNPDFAKILDRYSDSNWEKHILGDLYRNQGLASIKALDEVIAFVLQQQADGADITQEDLDDVRDAGRALAASLDDFLALAPPDDLRAVTKLVMDSPR
ncbi:unnamed protein product [Scytosiphon promiscuus]